jgi:flagellar biosynthesis regulator FlaF
VVLLDFIAEEEEIQALGYTGKMSFSLAVLCRMKNLFLLSETRANIIDLPSRARKDHV